MASNQYIMYVGSIGSVTAHQSFSMGGMCDLRDSGHVVIVGASSGGINISEIFKFLEISHSSMAGDYKGW